MDMLESLIFLNNDNNTDIIFDTIIQITKFKNNIDFFGKHETIATT